MELWNKELLLEEPEGYFNLTINSGASGSFRIPNIHNSEITIPYKYNWNISWGDGTIENVSGESVKVLDLNTLIPGIYHKYPNINKEYTISIKPINKEVGWLHAFGFSQNSSNNSESCNNFVNKNKLIGISAKFDLFMFHYLHDYCCAFLFYNCKNLILINLKFPQNLYKVGNNFCSEMFRNCEKLPIIDIILPQRLIYSGNNLFNGMFIGCLSLTNLGNLEFPKNLTFTGSLAFSTMFRYCSALTNLGNLKIPHNLSAISMCFSYTFANCYNLQTGVRKFFGDKVYVWNSLPLSQIFSNTFLDCRSIIEDLFDIPQIAEIFPTRPSRTFYLCPPALIAPLHENWKT